MTDLGARTRRAQLEEGIALVAVLLAMSLLTGLSLSLTLVTMPERKIVGHFSRGTEALYAADAGITRATRDLLSLADWNQALDGTTKSTFADGAAAGVRPGPGGLPFDLTHTTNMARCGKAACLNADLAALTDERPWRYNNPIWQPYAYGPLERLLPDPGADAQVYVVVWVGDDPSENDDDPLRDGGLPVGCDPARDPACPAANPGRGRLRLRSTAFGPDGTQRTIEATVGRADRPRLLAWKERR